MPEEPARGAPWAFLRSRERTVPLEPGQTYAIGRDPERNSLVLEDRSVSALHAQLRVLPAADGAALRDLGSRNGCFINEHRLHNAEERLSVGDRLRFGFDKATWLVQPLSSASAHAGSRAFSPPRPTHPAGLPGRASDGHSLSLIPI